MLLVSLIVGVLSSVVAGVMIALLLAFSNSNLATIAVLFVSGVLTTVLFTPITASAFVVLSIDLRVRKEGYDIQLLANQLGSQPGSSALSFSARASHVGRANERMGPSGRPLGFQSLSARKPTAEPARLGIAHPARLGTAGPARLGTAGSPRLGTAGPARSARLGPAPTRSTRLGARPPPAKLGAATAGAGRAPGVGTTSTRPARLGHRSARVAATFSRFAPAPAYRVGATSTSGTERERSSLGSRRAVELGSSRTTRARESTATFWSPPAPCAPPAPPAPSARLPLHRRRARRDQADQRVSKLESDSSVAVKQTS